MTVGLVQPALSVEQKHDRARRELNLALHRDMTAELERAGVELVIWPETAYPFTLPREVRRDRSGRRALRRGFEVPILFGAVTVDRGRHQRFNSVYLLERSGALVGPADKNRLLLFGEHVPFYDDLEWLQGQLPNVWNFTAGQRPTTLRSGELRVGVLNCYEDVIPELVLELARQQPNLLVNVSNDAWFGDTAEPHQHAAAARIRAVEHRVDLVRSVNSGVSTAVAATGVELARTEAFERTTRLVEVRRLEAGTVYTAIGDLWSWLVLLAAVAASFINGRRRRQKPGSVSPSL